MARKRNVTTRARMLFLKAKIKTLIRFRSVRPHKSVKVKFRRVSLRQTFPKIGRSVTENIPFEQSEVLSTEGLCIVINLQQAN